MGQNMDEAFAAAWFLAIGKRGFDDAGVAAAAVTRAGGATAAGASAAEPPPIDRPHVIITVSLDDLEGPAAGC